MSNSEELIRLTADAQDKMNKFHEVLYSSMATHTSSPPNDPAKDSKMLKNNSPEGIAYKKAVERLRIYKAAD